MKKPSENTPMIEVTIQHQAEEKPRFDNVVLGYFSALVAQVSQEELDAENHPGKEGSVFRIEVYMENLTDIELGTVLHYIEMRYPEAIDAYLRLQAEEVDGHIEASFKAVEESEEEQDGDVDDED